MPRFLLSFVLLLIAMVASAQQSLPTVRLTGTFGSDYQPGTIEIEGESYPVSVKWRGATTGGDQKHKHHFKIKFPSNQSFFGMRSDNNWLLDAGQADPFRLRNRIATDLWLDMARKPYYADQEPQALSGVRGRVVELYLNGQYEGIYCFTENIDRKQMQLTKQTKTNIRGVLWKAEGYRYANMWDVENDYDNTKPTWGSFEAKYPDLEDRDTTDYSTLYRAIDFVVNSSNDEFSAHVADYFDLPAVMDYYLFINALGAVDNVGKNTFWAVYDQLSSDRRLTPAVWDLDLTVGAPLLAKFNPVFDDPDLVLFGGINLVHRLITLNVDNWNSLAYERWQELRQSWLATDALIQRYRDAVELLEESGAARRETDRWSGDSDILGATIDFRRDADSIAWWLNIHLPLLDTVLCDTTIIRILGINTALAQQPWRPNQPVYNLQGQRQRTDLPLRPGLYIRSGRKFVVKRR